MSNATSRSAWTEQEDELLRAAVAKFGDRAWALVSSEVPHRTSKSCSDRWRNFLSPEIAHPRKNPFTDWEVAVVVLGQQKYGNNWKAISMLLPGRTNRAVKNLFVGNLKNGARLQASKNMYLAAGKLLEDVVKNRPMGHQVMSTGATDDDGGDDGCDDGCDDEGDISGDEDSGGSGYVPDERGGSMFSIPAEAMCGINEDVGVGTGGSIGSGGRKREAAGGGQGSALTPTEGQSAHKRRRGGSSPHQQPPSSSPPGSPGSSKSSGGLYLGKKQPLGLSRLFKLSRCSSGSGDGLSGSPRYHPYSQTATAGACSGGVVEFGSSNGRRVNGLMGGALPGLPHIPGEAKMRVSSAASELGVTTGRVSPAQRVVSPFEAAAHLDSDVQEAPVAGSKQQDRYCLSYQGTGSSSGQTVFDLSGAPSWTLPLQASLAGVTASGAASDTLLGPTSAHGSNAINMRPMGPASLTLEALGLLMDGSPAAAAAAVDPVTFQLQQGEAGTEVFDLTGVPSLEGMPSMPSLMQYELMPGSSTAPGTAAVAMAKAPADTPANNSKVSKSVPAQLPEGKSKPATQSCTSCSCLAQENQHLHQQLVEAQQELLHLRQENAVLRGASFVISSPAADPSAAPPLAPHKQQEVAAPPAAAPADIPTPASSTLLHPVLNSGRQAAPCSISSPPLPARPLSPLHMMVGTPALAAPNGTNPSSNSSSSSSSIQRHLHLGAASAAVAGHPTSMPAGLPAAAQMGRPAAAPFDAVPAMTFGGAALGTGASAMPCSAAGSYPAVSPTNLASGAPLYPRLEAGGPLPADLPTLTHAALFGSGRALQQQQHQQQSLQVVPGGFDVTNQLGWPGATAASPRS